MTSSHIRVRGRPEDRPDRLASMIVQRPGKFEEFRWIGDKRTRIVYDVDGLSDGSVIDELMEAGSYASFGPDTLAEARNRGYHPFNGTGTD